MFSSGFIDNIVRINIYNKNNICRIKNRQQNRAICINDSGNITSHVLTLRKRYNKQYPYRVIYL